MSAGPAVIASKTKWANAARLNKSITASAEKRLLCWMAERAPAWVTSDGLTALGLAAQLGAGLCYAVARVHRSSLLLVCACIVLNWFGDSLDGTLARVRNRQRPRFGFYVDHMVDVFGTIALMCGLALSGLVHWQVALAMLLAFLVLSAESYLATYTLGRFEMSQGAFGPTELRILLIAANLAILRTPFCTVFGHRMLLVDLGGTIGTVAMAALAVVTTLRHTAALYREEPLA